MNKLDLIPFPDAENIEAWQVIERGPMGLNSIVSTHIIETQFGEKAERRAYGAALRSLAFAEFEMRTEREKYFSAGVEK